MELIKSRPKEFINLSTLIPTLETDVKYFSGDNFFGSRVDGYHSPVILVTTECAKALSKVQNNLLEVGYSLRVFDGYRPSRVDEQLMHWLKNTDTSTKEDFYPDYEKSELISQGFIHLPSDHSRGSSVDLTVIDLKNGNALDMGTPYHFFSPLSKIDNKDITPRQSFNRLQLKYLMLSFGFNAKPHGWWHFTLKEEPYPYTYFDFAISE